MRATRHDRCIFTPDGNGHHAVRIHQPRIAQRVDAFGRCSRRRLFARSHLDSSSRERTRNAARRPNTQEHLAISSDENLASKLYSVPPELGIVLFRDRPTSERVLTLCLMRRFRSAGATWGRTRFEIHSLLQSSTSHLCWCLDVHGSLGERTARLHRRARDSGWAKRASRPLVAVSDRATTVPSCAFLTRR